MTETTFSVVIPTCDRLEYLREAVDSVLAQTQPAHEILVIDNGRDPLDPVQLPVNENVRVIRALPRFGVSQARNLGAILATGKYIAFLDDDDTWGASYLMAVSEAVAETGAQVVLGRLRSLDGGAPLQGKQADFTDRYDLIHQILLRNPGAVGSNTTVERAAFAVSSGYDPWITTGQDKGLVLDLLLSGKSVTRASGAWVNFRMDTEGSRQTDLQKRIRGKWRFTQKYWRHMDSQKRLFNLAQLSRLWLRRLLGVNILLYGRI